MSVDNHNAALRGQVQVLVTLTTKYDWAGIVPHGQLGYKDPRFSSKKCLRQGLHCALRRSVKAEPACRHWPSPPASFVCTFTCSVLLWTPILHSLKNALGRYLDSDLAGVYCEHIIVGIKLPSSPFMTVRA